jgi:hypothetical protein
MKSRILLSIVFAFLSMITLSQNSDTLFVRYDLHNSDKIEYTTDTLIRKSSFGPHFLFETVWITNTRHQLNALSYGLKPVKVESECEVRGIESGENRLVSIFQSDSIIEIEYKVASNCCFSFLCDFEILDSETINLKYIDYGTVCGCTCYHTLKYTLKKDFLDPENRRLFGELKYLTLNGELKTKLD